MNIADKSTLDIIHNLLNNKGNYIGYKNTSSSMRYYLPAGVKIICDKSRVEAYQHQGEVILIDEGYEISENSLVTIRNIQGNYIEYVAYNIM